MIVTKGILLARFLKWRDLYFSDFLDIPKFVLTKNFRHVARFECILNGCDDSISDETIFFSTEYDYTDKQLDELMCHEMIHYYLCKAMIDTKCSHGFFFMNLAREINEKFLLNIDEYVYGLTKKDGYSRFHYFFSFLE